MNDRDREREIFERINPGVRESRLHDDIYDQGYRIVTDSHEDRKHKRTGYRIAFGALFVWVMFTDLMDRLFPGKDAEDMTDAEAWFSLIGSLGNVIIIITLVVMWYKIKDGER